MSGLNQIKQKAKLSLDEMYESETVGKPTIQKSRKPENNLAENPSVRLEDSIIEVKGKKESDSTSEIGFNQENVMNEKTKALTEKQESRNPESWKANTLTNQKSNVYKMTFNLSEKSYKKFNDLYAKRMLKGCKTEKSELICEAIDWLVKMEN